MTSPFQRAAFTEVRDRSRGRPARAIAAFVTAVCAGAVLVVRAPAQPAPEPVVLRFHHLHYRAPEPAVAMREAAARLSGTRVILQGLGVGVRAGREYVLFDRSEESTAPASAPPSGGRRPAEDLITQAAEWLRQRSTLTFGNAALPAWLDHAPGSYGALDHLAFAAGNLEAARAAIDAPPFATNVESARYRLPSGLIVEIVRDTGLPDSHWCPMHPDVRAPAEAKCPLCGMDLVPIPPPRLGEYRLDVSMVPRTPGEGIAELHFTVRDPETEEVVTTFLEVHEQLFHLFIISRDLTEFAHVHPDQEDDGSFVLKHDLGGGEYLLIADFLPAGGTSQMVQRAIVTPGYSARVFAPAPTLAPTSLEQVVGGVRVTLDASAVTPVRPSTLRFDIRDAVSGSPITDIEPYLGASGHLLIVDRELTMAIHGHPEGPVSGGPQIVFDPVLPAAGFYKLWVQFQRHGRLFTVPFVIEVPRG